MFLQTRLAPPIDNESAKIAPAMAELVGQDVAGVLAGQTGPGLSRTRVPFPMPPLLLLPPATGALPKGTRTLSQERKIRKKKPDSFRKAQ